MTRVKYSGVGKGQPLLFPNDRGGKELKRLWNLAKLYSSNHEAPNFNVPFIGPNKKNGDWTETVQGKRKQR